MKGTCAAVAAGCRSRDWQKACGTVLVIRMRGDNMPQSRLACIEVDAAVAAGKCKSWVPNALACGPPS